EREWTCRRSSGLASAAKKGCSLRKLSAMGRCLETGKQACSIYHSTSLGRLKRAPRAGQRFRRRADHKQGEVPVRRMHIGIYRFERRSGHGRPPEAATCRRFFNCDVESTGSGCFFLSAADNKTCKLRRKACGRSSFGGAAGKPQQPDRRCPASIF